MAKEETKCKHCSSPEIKKTFLGGSGKFLGIFFIFLGLASIMGDFLAPSHNILPGLIFLLVGIAAVITPKYECKSCKKKFS